VDVDWRVEGDRLVLEWTERGGPEVVPPKATGFGSRLIRKLAKGDLEGEAVMDYAPEGLRFRLAAPLKPRP
jgi:two-component sensor histidine kinase